MCQQLTEAEVSELIGAERGERAPEARMTYRNEYRGRGSQTRAAELEELAIPKLRRGSYFPNGRFPPVALKSLTAEAPPWVRIPPRRWFGSTRPAH